VAGVIVSAIEARHNATTDTNGFFSLELREGTKPGADIRIHIEKEGYRAVDLTEAASENVTYPIRISRLGKANSASPMVIAIPEVSIRTDPGLAASDFPSRTISPDMMHNLRRHRLNISNRNSIDLRDLAIRFQLPEPVIGGLVIEDRPAGVEIVWHACRMRFNLIGEGASSHPTPDGGTMITTAPIPGSGAAMSAQSEECSGSMDSKDLPPTGLYQLKIARLPAKTAIRVAFLTSIGPEGQFYLEAMRDMPSGDSLVYFGNGTWNCLIGDRVETRKILIPLRIDTGSRAIMTEPSSEENKDRHLIIIHMS
jgi:hypothetical protein